MPETFEPFQMTVSRDSLSSFEELKSDTPPQNLKPSEEPIEQTSPPLSNGSESDPNPPPANVPQHNASDTPKLFVDREQGRIVRIRVLCSCGLSTTLKCNYEAKLEETPQPQSIEKPTESALDPAPPKPSAESASA